MDYSAINLLIVSNNSDNRREYTNVLSNQNEAKFNVFETIDTNKAIPICASQPIDCVLFDRNQIDQQDIIFLTSLRQQCLKDNTDIPVILITEKEDQVLARLCLENGIQDFLIKKSASNTSILSAITRAVRTSHEHKNSLTTSIENPNENNSLFGYVLEQVKDSLIIFQIENGKLIEVSNGAASTFGIEREEFIDKSIYEIPSFEPGFHDWKKNIELAKQTNKDVIFNTYYKTGNGKISSLKVNLNFIENNGVDYIVAMAHDLNTKQILDEKFQDIAFIDNDTKIYTSQYLKMNLEKEFRRAMRMAYPLSVVIVSIHNIDKISNLEPSISKSEIIRNISQTIAYNLKRAGDFVSHYNGQDFAIILPNTNHNQAQALCDIIIEKIYTKYDFFNPEKNNGNLLTISMGIATEIPSINNNVKDFLQNAISANKVAVEKKQSSMAFAFNQKS